VPHLTGVSGFAVFIQSMPVCDNCWATNSFQASEANIGITHPNCQSKCNVGFETRFASNSRSDWNAFQMAAVKAK